MSRPPRRDRPGARRSGAITVGGIAFERRELLDLGAAWLALAVAFTLFVETPASIESVADLRGLGPTLLVSLLAVGTGFLLHELAHKIFAVRFGQVAGFRASYPMLGLAIASGLAGFLFAAPGAVYHRGRISVRERGLVAVAGPVTNLGLVLAFAPLAFAPGLAGEIGRWGALVNAFLAAFNMLPAGPLDGKTVLAWSKPVFGLVLAVAVAATGAAVLAFV